MTGKALEDEMMKTFGLATAQWADWTAWKLTGKKVLNPMKLEKALATLNDGGPDEGESLREYVARLYGQSAARLAERALEGGD